ncbi:MAG: hypothetical protein KGI57_05850 [Hyphomicrobiales bacterium]|nr:hypothetical protein [Hyphomicrobiales bacterium]MDE2017212.1 hypothetical protein [Hyphomicrobiales bacterium]
MSRAMVAAAMVAALTGLAHADMLSDLTNSMGAKPNAPPAAGPAKTEAPTPAAAGQVSVDPANYDRLRQILSGYGRVDAFTVAKTGRATAKMTTDGEAYFFNVAGVRGKPCGGNCDTYIDVCNSNWRKPTFDDLIQWVNVHYSYVVWFKDDGTCLHLDLPTYGQPLTEKKLDNAFRIWLGDFKDLRAKFAG